MSRRLMYLIGLALIAVLAGCAQGVTVPAPPEIRYGEDVCVGCNMIISDERYASAYAYEIETGRFESLPFDDIGGMVGYAKKHPDHNVVRWWVHDYNTKEWIDATTAFYMASDDLQTPMGFGVAAFAQQADAEAFAAELGGVVLAWEEAREHMTASPGGM